MSLEDKARLQARPYRQAQREVAEISLQLFYYKP